jgi:hypothetical protein
MAYLQTSGGEPVSHDLILAMSRIYRLEVPEEDLEPLAIALRDQLASIERLEALDLAGIVPVLQFDPRWHD